ncbi:hypothetical protein HN789_05070 [archaeon]|jgi:hypothetical protein|nr:hypothetical protein [archaeon]MBT4022884.1 hypothetical protein [archaeon]MBT4272531.1 hypothetical protein [archaeon]MBT4460401.1 hypothetical protein [archaeon]MBT4859032.1 hypothetical protein [archaeon]
MNNQEDEIEKFKRIKEIQECLKSLVYNKQSLNDYFEVLEQTPSSQKKYYVSLKKPLRNKF